MARAHLAASVALLLACACSGGGGGAQAPILARFEAGWTTTITAVFPEHMTTGHFDADGRIDVAALGPVIWGTDRDWGVQAFLGDGTGGLVPAAPLYGPSGYGDEDPRWLLAGNFNFDGALDLLVLISTGTDTKAFFLFGHGDGTFGPGGRYPAYLGFPITDADVLDSDGDSLDDVAFGTEDGRVGTLLSSGLGDLVTSSVVTLPNAAKVRSIAVCDADRDGRSDVVAVQDNDIVRVVLGDGWGGLALAWGKDVTVGTDHLAVDRAVDTQLVAAFATHPVPHMDVYPRDANHDLMGTPRRLDLTPGYTARTDLVPLRVAMPVATRFAVLGWPSGIDERAVLFLADSDATTPYAEAIQLDGLPRSMVAADLDADGDDDLVLGDSVIEAAPTPHYVLRLRTLLSTGR